MPGTATPMTLAPQARAWRRACAVALLALPALAWAQSGLTLTPQREPGLSLNYVDVGWNFKTSEVAGQPLNLFLGRSLLPPEQPSVANGLTPHLGSTPSSILSVSQRRWPDEFGFIGLQFKDGARLTLRRSEGGLGLSYRVKF